MKTKHIFQIVILLITIIILSCSKNDPPINDKNNTNNDSTNISDTNGIDTLCTYNNIVLDTNNLLHNIGDSIIGSWELIAYADIKECSFTEKPEEITRDITINFQDSINVNGGTLVNTFNGQYTISDNIIEFIELKMTLVYHPSDWDNIFSTEIYNVDLININNNNLIMYYSKLQKAMIFSKIKNSI